MTTQTAANSLSGTELYDAAMAELLWPSERRIIYCSITGRPWGIVSEDYVHYIIANFGASNKEELQKRIDRMTLFNGPSPLWQSKTPDLLATIKLIDPTGFLIYLLNTILRLEHVAKADIDAMVEWRKSMVRLYATLDVLPKKEIDRTNDILLMMSGEGFLPPLYLLPSRELTPYGKLETLIDLTKICREYYLRRKTERVHYRVQRTSSDKHRPPNPLHQRIVTKDLGMDALNEETKKRLIDLMIVDVMMTVDKNYTKAEHEKAREQTGIASPSVALFKRLETEFSSRAKKVGTKAIIATNGAMINITRKKQS